MPDRPRPQGLPDTVRGLVREIRVPGLPYPIGQVAHPAPWGELLRKQWAGRCDRRVCELLAALEGPWSTRQVNGAYLADRIMDVYLRSSGLHPVLIARLARLRYPLAWQLATDEPTTFLDPLVPWLDSFDDWRGWSDSGGRSSRALLERLEQLETIIDGFFDTGTLDPLLEFCQQWYADARRRRERSGRLHARLLETETGAARQRRADQQARAVVGRALEGRRLPAEIQHFVIHQWLPLMRQVAWQQGLDGENWRHGSRLLEWLVWAGDPELTRQDLERLYQVGEQLTDRLSEVWRRVWTEPVPREALAAIERVLVEALKGGEPAVVTTRESLAALAYDTRWLSPPDHDEEAGEDYVGQWFVTGDGKEEQRWFFLGWLGETSEVLWSNGFGVRLGLSAWAEVRQGLESGLIRRLPELTRFSQVVDDTVSALDRVLGSQREKRQQAAHQARAKAEQLRRQKAAAERQRQEAEARRLAEAEQAQQQARESARRQAEEQLEAARARALELAMAETDKLSTGGWIALQSDTDPGQEQRLKLAVRINARRKLIFVDRLGLNRTELTTDELAGRLQAGTARILGPSAEFDETLSRVVGRIRVGR